MQPGQGDDGGGRRFAPVSMSAAERLAAEASSSPSAVRRCVLLFYAGVLALGLATILLHRGAAAVPRLVLGPGAASSALAGAAVAIAVLAATHAGFRRLRWMRRLGRVVRRFFGPLSMPQAVGLGVVSGVAEEVLFRGALQPLVGLTATSLLFGALHILPPLRHNWPWTAFAVGMGFVLGGITQETDNLTGAVLAHAAINAVNLGRIGRL